MAMMVERSDSADDYSDEDGWQIINESSSSLSLPPPTTTTTTTMTTAPPPEQPVIYLNNASQARLCDEAKIAGINAIQQSGLIPGVDNNQQRVRELFAKIIEADDDEESQSRCGKDGIAIMPSTAFAITFAARNIQRASTKQSGRIVLLQDQHNSAV